MFAIIWCTFELDFCFSQLVLRRSVQEIFQKTNDKSESWWNCKLNSHVVLYFQVQFFDICLYSKKVLQLEGCVLLLSLFNLEKIILYRTELWTERLFVITSRSLWGLNWFGKNFYKTFMRSNFSENPPYHRELYCTTSNLHTVEICFIAQYLSI